PLSLAPNASFMAFDSFKGGVYVSIGDVNGDGRPDILTGQGSGGKGLLNIWDVTFNATSPAYTVSQLASYQAFSNGQVRVSTVVIDDDMLGNYMEIFTSTGAGGNAQVGVWTVKSV